MGSRVQHVVVFIAAISVCAAADAEMFTCPPTCGLGYGVNTTFDAATGADDAAPGDGLCETAIGNNVCTLRAAIEEANAYSSSHGGVTNFIGVNPPASDPNYNGIFWTINLVAALPDISTPMNVAGPGPNKLTVKRNTTANYRIFNITATSPVTISDMTMTNGNIGSGGVGGNIAVNGATGTLNLSNCTISGGFAKNGGGMINNGIMNLRNCTVSGNTAGNLGGAIQNSGTATFSNCTVSGNSVTGFNNAGGIDNFGTFNLTNCTITGNFTTQSGTNGGGIYNGGGTMNITNCTVTGNAAAGSGGGIFSSASTANLKSTVIAGNTAGTGPDLNGSFTPQGFNLIGKNDTVTANFPAGNPNANNDIVGTSASPINPLLDPNGLQNNGGPTLTIALLAGSPAIDKGTSIGSTGALIVDQRGVGYVRIVDDPFTANAAGGNGADVGAFEFGAHINAFSVKTHGGTDFLLDLPVVGTPGVECRRNTGADVGGPNAGRDHEVVLTFPTTVTMGTATVTNSTSADGSSVTRSVNANVITLDLHSVADAPRRLTIDLFNVSDGTNTNNISVPLNILPGDATGDGAVNSADIGLTKSKTGQALDSTNFRTDPNVDGSINSADVGLVKSRSGTALP